ncbi:conserved hypothetical protein [Paraburkholderia unamae]|uniref:hypothetical protein n=1 Tax=Paraburkholderia unamae TaxID=219649 RepID=UPI001CB42163|nr:hypothetical protein [Paraburkholderia unamae]CAG9249057.1 conserved hypothetical protein [Paraburkholderia unamae]
MENAVCLEAHYYLKNDSHSIDAIVRNRCEAEFLATVSYIAQCLGAELRFEASVPTDGGFRDIWRVLIRKDNRAIAVSAFTGILNALLAAAVQIWLSPAKPNEELERQQSEINRLTIEHWKVENQRSELEVQKLKRELDAGTAATLHRSPPDTTAPKPPVSSIHVSPLTQPEQIFSLSTFGSGEFKRLSLQMDPKLNRRRSNFYKQLISYSAVTAVGFRWLPHDEPALHEQVVQRADFSNFVLQGDKLAPEVTEAIIEIVAPVITHGDIQWKGRWNDQAISFNMDDKAYKEDVLHSQVRFQHGDSIRCVLESERKLDEFGNAKVTGHRVTTVLDRIEGNGEIHETPQGRKKRFEKRHANGQFGLFDGDEACLS